MVFKEGDMVLANYSLFIKETGDLVETTKEEVAKLYKKYEEDKEYAPEVFIIGEGRYVKGIEEAVKNAEELNKEYEVEIPPEKAYGARDPNKVKVFSRKIFIKNNVVPEVGKEVTVGNSTGRVIAVGGGRVTVDFNHPLAGKTLVFKFNIIKKVEDPQEKIKYLVKRRVKKVRLEDIKVSLKTEEGNVEIELPKDFRLADGVNILKYLIAKDIIKWVDWVKEVIFTDRFTADDFGKSGGSGE